MDLIAGRFDGIISCQDVQLHYERMKEVGGVPSFHSKVVCGYCLVRAVDV